MNKKIEYFSRKFGLTTTEINTIIFVVVVFIFGIVAKSVKLSLFTTDEQHFDYSFQDSLFKALSERDKSDLIKLKKKEKRVDSEVELSDFSKREKVSNKELNITLKENSININTADEKTLRKIPGIGLKTARAIIKYRLEKLKFGSLEELIDVKGIGKKKLVKIKKYIYLEK